MTAPSAVAAAMHLVMAFAFVVRQAQSSGKRKDETDEALSETGRVAPVRIMHRVAFRVALGLRLGVTEFEPDGRAAAEMLTLWKWIKEHAGL